MVCWFSYIHIDKYNTITLWLSITFPCFCLSEIEQMVSVERPVAQWTRLLFGLSANSPIFPFTVWTSLGVLLVFVWNQPVFGALDDILTNCWNIFNRLSAPISNQEDTAVFYPIKSVYWSWRVEVVRSAIS